MVLAEIRCSKCFGNFSLKLLIICYVYLNNSSLLKLLVDSRKSNRGRDYSQFLKLLRKWEKVCFRKRQGVVTCGHT